MNQMRSSQKNRNARHKGGRPNRPTGNVVNRVHESAGPEGKVRGTPQQIIDKYQQLARDAQTSGDRVTAENFLQHAEHYVRLLNAALPPQDERRAGAQGSGEDDDGTGDDRQYDNRQPDSRQPDSRQYEGRQSDSRQPESRPSDNRQGDSRYNDSRNGDTRNGEARQGDGRSDQNRRRDPRQPDDRAEARPAEDRTADQPDDRAEARPAEARREPREHIDPRDAAPQPPAQPEVQPHAEAAAPAPKAAAVATADATPSSGLETIDGPEPDEQGPVATPEAAEEVKPKPRRRTRKPKAVDEAPAES